MKKSFDCVQLKNDIQKKLIKEYKNLTLADRKALMMKRISHDPILGSWLKEITQPLQPIVAEESAPYVISEHK